MWLNKLKNSSLFFLIITIPFARLFNINSYAIVLFVLVFFFSARKKAFRKSHLSFALLGVYYLLICANVLWLKPSGSLSGLIKYLPIFLLPLGVFFSSYQKKTLPVFVYSIAFTCLLCILYTYVKSKGYIFYYHNPTEIIDLQINYLGVFVSFSLAILYNELLSTNVAKLKHYVLLPFFFFSLAFLFNRTGILASVLVTFSFIFIYFRKYKNLKFLLVFVTFFCLSLSYIFTRPIIKHKFQQILEQDYRNNIDYSDGIGSRLLSWQCSLNNIREAGLFGYGIDNSKTLLKNCYKSKLGDNSVQFRHGYNAHNQFLQTSLDLGLLGLVILLSIYGLVLYCGLAHKNPLLVFYFIIIVIFGMTESFIIRQWGLVFFIFFTSYLLLHHHHLK